MKIEWLQSFLALIHYRNFSEAAESRYISQSMLSKHIMAMEKELGVELFTRSSRSVNLTPAGERILPHVQNIAIEFDIIKNEVWNYNNERRNKVCITTLCDLSQYGIADLIITWEQAHHGIHVETRENSHEIMYNNIVNGVSVCALGFKELWDDISDYNVIKLREERLVIVCHKTHPLAVNGITRLHDAHDQQYCFTKEDHQLYDYFLRSCLNVGFMPRLTLSEVRFATIKEYIRHGMRITISPESRARHCFDSDEFHIIPLEDVKPLTFALLTKHKTLTPLYASFVAHTIDYMKVESNT